MVTTILHAQQLIAGLKYHHVNNIIISPGSRNAPLTLSLGNDPYFTCYSIVDERCAAHVALGMAQITNNPVALLCTSGSALLNYYPAITEAFYSNIPLIAISADRPPHKIDIGDGQTIRQQDVFKNHILHSIQIEMLDDLNDQVKIDTNAALISQAINTSIKKCGPVHINIPFEEPLYNVVAQASDFNYKGDVNLVKENTVVLPENFTNHWEQAQRILVLIGTLNPDVLDKTDLDRLLNDPRVLVFTEVSANLVHKKTIDSIDSLLAPIEDDEMALNDLQPDLVITMGGMVVSKKIKQFLRKYAPQAHYHIGTNPANDTFFKLKSLPAIDPKKWIAQLEVPAFKSTYQSNWLNIFNQHLNRATTYKKQLPWSDFKAFNLIFNKIHELDNIILHLGNSSTIRYALLFKMNASHTIYSNRGTSGIDGCTSTAIGAAMASDKPVFFITGELSFLYDSNALWNNYIPPNFKMIVINNGGGGIFRILPGEKDTAVFDTYFETIHQLDASHLCKMYDVGYHRVDDDYAFAKAYKLFSSQNHKPQLLEIFTPRQENNTVLLDYFKFLQ